MKKTCTKCKKQKNETDFPLTKVRGRMLRRSWCDLCMKAYYKAYRLAKVKQRSWVRAVSVSQKMN